MREIKFRAWHKELKEMFFDIKVNSEQWLSKDEHRGGDTEFIMQFTGLKDKNGKEIFEGDIVKVFGAFSDDEWSLYKISYFECGFVSEFIKNVNYPKKFEVSGKMNNCEFINRDNFFEDCEVIGNIYENPELLENKK